LFEAYALLNKQEESKSWLIATITILVIAAFVFLIQRFAGPVFDFVFEVCIFYVPTVVMVFLLLYFRQKS
jgi:antibiotic biosynthesis monooxygenase (ABM) superfamily enzyme